MSEYQYYEFQAIDRPLDRAAQEEVRSVSSRARITATSFTNEYNWGDFRGDPRKFMERWFDLHLYLANWGTRRLMLRVPGRLLSVSDLDPFLGESDDVKVWASGDNLIVDIARDEVEIEDHWEDDSDRLAAIAPLRSDVLAATCGTAVWREIEVEIARRNPSGYDRAVRLLLELQALAAEDGNGSDFDRRLAVIRRQHETKRKFIERLVVLGGEERLV